MVLPSPLCICCDLPLARRPSSSSPNWNGEHLSTTKTVKEGFIAGLVEPLDRLIEGIYSVLIVLTFTLATRAIQVQSGEVADRFDLLLQLFVAALGCAVAWGLIDGAMYVLTCVFERGKDQRLYRLVRNAPSEEEGIAVLADELDDDMGSLATSAERRDIYQNPVCSPAPVAAAAGRL